MQNIHSNSSFKVHKSGLKLGGQSLFSSVNKQELRLMERKNANNITVEIKNIKCNISPGVYKTGVDTELMIDVLRKEKRKSFLEVGCGCGAISIFLAKNNNNGVAIDINSIAVENTAQNCKLNEVDNLIIKQSNVFENVDSMFDLIICNPPYNMHEVNDDIDRMFWDPSNSMKRTFFSEVSLYLKKNGKLYFGWADFADLDFNFPIIMAKANGLKLLNTYARPSKCSSYRFLVFEFSL